MGCHLLASLGEAPTVESGDVLASTNAVFQTPWKLDISDLKFPSSDFKIRVDGFAQSLQVGTQTLSGVPLYFY